MGKLTHNPVKVPGIGSDIPFFPSLSIPGETFSHHYSPVNEVQIPLIQGTGEKNLDTLAQLRKLARNKYITNGLIYRLVDIKFSPLRKSYWNTFHCTRELDQENITLTGKYCNNRWCNQCNRIRTAKLMNGYSPVLQSITDKYFVTLTIPNVPGKKLKTSIELMQAVFKNIKDCMRKRHYPVIGLRKLECTYNHALENYHPHFHLIVKGKDIAEMIVSEWLNTFPEANRKAQDIREADDNSVKELFKYFSKLITNTDKGRTFHVESLDVIFQAMRKKRVFQPMGIKKIPEKIEEKQKCVVPELTPSYKVWLFDDKKGDFFDSGGTALTGYVPGDIIKKLRGETHDIDWRSLEAEFKAIRRFDMREYWEERGEHWEKVHKKRDRNQEIVNQAFENWINSE